MINVDTIKTKISRAIENAPTTVTFIRKQYISDGVNGRIPNGELVFANVTGLLDNSSVSSYNHYRSDPGAKEDGVTSTFYTVCTSSYTPEIGDYFIIDNKKYTVGAAEDVLLLHIYWNMVLEMEVIE